MSISRFSPRRLFVRLLRERDGATVVEYAVMLAMIILVCLLAIQAFGGTVSNTFSDSNAKMAPHMTGS